MYGLVARSVQYANDSFQEALGYSPQDKEALPGLERLIHPDDLAVFEEEVIAFTALKKSDGHSFTCRINRNEAGCVSWQLTGRGLQRDELGQVESVLFFARDGQAEVTLAAETRELERKISELKRSNKDLEEFAYIASHDMHEPLRKVHSFADRLKVKFGGSVEDEAKGYLDRILAATQNARLMIDGLMEFSRLSRNGFGFQKVSMNELVKEVLEDLELIIDETGTQVDVDALPSIEVIPIQMKQLFTNVILNAIKFRKEGSPPRLKIQSRKLEDAERIGHALDSPAVHHQFTITDNGIGFEKEYAETIFQMFQRLNGKSEYPGSGIGLALCRKITDNHHGVIVATGIPGEGTTITLTLPEINRK